MAQEIISQLLRARVARLRRHLPSGPLDRPREIAYDTYRLGGRLLRRLRIILRSNGCRIPTCTMCHLPNLTVPRNEGIVRIADYVQQISEAIDAATPVDAIAVYNDGSFFSDAELPPEAREYVYAAAERLGVYCLMVESLPSFVTESSITSAISRLRHVKLAVAMGLQSSDLDVRRLCIMTPVEEAEFVRARKLLQSLSVLAKVYLLLKPAFLTEDEAISDCVRSICWLEPQGIDDISICPARVESGTLLEDLFDKRLYVPPRFRALIQVLQTLGGIRKSVRMSLVNTVFSSTTRAVADGCHACRALMSSALLAFNDGSEDNLGHIGDCAVCKEYAEHFLPSEYRVLSLQERITRYLESI